MNNTGRNGLLCFALGIVLALGMLLAHQHVFTDAYAAADDKGGLQAVGTNLFNKRGNGCLWIYNADERQLACYQCITGRAIKLVGARKVTWDLELKQHPADKSKWTPNELKEQFEKASKKDKGGK